MWEWIHHFWYFNLRGDFPWIPLVEYSFKGPLSPSRMRLRYVRRHASTFCSSHVKLLFMELVSQSQTRTAWDKTIIMLVHLTTLLYIQYYGYMVGSSRQFSLIIGSCFYKTRWFRAKFIGITSRTLYWNVCDQGLNDCHVLMYEIN